MEELGKMWQEVMFLLGPKLTSEQETLAFRKGENKVTILTNMSVFERETEGFLP